MGLREHFASYYGEARRLAGPRPEADPPVSVYGFPPEESRAWWVLATDGMSQKPMSTAGARFPCLVRDPRVEIVLYVSGEAAPDPAFPALLLDLAAYVWRNDTFIHWMHMVPLGRPVLPGSGLRSILFRLPRLEGNGFARVEGAGGERHVLWACPLYDEERLFARRKGLEALERKLDRLGMGVIEFDRECVVPRAAEEKT